MSKFCPDCEDEREFRRESRTETYSVRGMQVSMPVEVEVCTTCGGTLFDEDRDQALTLECYSRYRQGNGLLFPEEIKAVREKYALSQKSFAALLGMSEATINRYEHGSLQEETHDNLMRMASVPQTMKDLLEHHGDRLSE